MGINDLPGEMLERVVARLREAEPDAIAIVATGSYARGEAAPGSDLDLAVVTPIKPRGGRPHLVRAAAGRRAARLDRG
jgi:predicted nucleotidyltransferase